MSPAGWSWTPEEKSAARGAVGIRPEDGWALVEVEPSKVGTHAILGRRTGEFLQLLAPHASGLSGWVLGTDSGYPRPTPTRGRIALSGYAVLFVLAGAGLMFWLGIRAVDEGYLWHRHPATVVQCLHDRYGHCRIDVSVDGRTVRAVAPLDGNPQPGAKVTVAAPGAPPWTGALAEPGGVWYPAVAALGLGSGTLLVAGAAFGAVKTSGLARRRQRTDAAGN